MFKFLCLRVQTSGIHCHTVVGSYSDFRMFTRLCVRSCSDICALMSRTSCVHQIFLRSCPEYRAFNRLSCLHHQTFVPFMFSLSCVQVQTFVGSWSDFRSLMSRTSFVHQIFLCSCSDFCAFTTFSCVHVQNFMRSCPEIRAFTRLSGLHHQTFVPSCSDFRAFRSRLSCVQHALMCSYSDFRAFMSIY